MYEIPPPETLSAERLGSQQKDATSTREQRERAERLATELRDTCAYAQMLWDRLNVVRRYLVQSLPAPSASGPGGIGCAAPRGRDDEQGWRAWLDIYADVTATLAGPRGDSGFAADEARRIMCSRRLFPADQQPTIETIEARPGG
jgi:hypothetical protein